MTQRSIILSGTPEKYEYLGENETKNETFLTHWSVAQAGSNDEKNGGRKSCWTVPLSAVDMLVYTGRNLLQNVFKKSASKFRIFS